jgi:hypothetical protein
MAGAWDVFDVDVDGATIGPGDPVWTEGYERDVGHLFATLRSTGAAVVAVAPPCFGRNEQPGAGPEVPERLDPVRVGAVHRVWMNQAAMHGVVLADLDSLLCPNGNSDSSIRPDGAHFYTAGADATAPVVMDFVRDAIAASGSASVLGAYAP